MKSDETKYKHCARGYLTIHRIRSNEKDMTVTLCLFDSDRVSNMQRSIERISATLHADEQKRKKRKNNWFIKILKEYDDND